MSGARLNVVPTVTVLAQIKLRLIGANKGHGLLKKKADALTLRFRQLLKEILDCKTQMGETMKASYFALTEVKYAAGEGPRGVPSHVHSLLRLPRARWQWHGRGGSILQLHALTPPPPLLPLPSTAQVTACSTR